MTALYEQAERWYRDNAQMLQKHFEHVRFRSNASDVEGGAVGFDFEASTLVATIALWNKGDVDVEALKRGSQEPVILDDRVLAPTEKIPDLLDGYIKQILALA